MSAEVEPDATSPEPGACPRCRELEQRVAELERRLAEANREREPGPLVVKALKIKDGSWLEGWRLRPSPARRHWMDGLPYSYQCLPMVMANQWGWQVLCPTDVRVTWNGSPHSTGLRVEVEPPYTVAIKSQFGLGIVTFSLPWLFRTSPGWDLYVKGPGNRWKPNCVPLEGVIETWWLNYTFTMNWKLVEPGTVEFAKGESLCQLVPVPHGTFDGASAVEALLGTAEPEAQSELLHWLSERRRVAREPDSLVRFYRKADGVDDHLAKASVPPFKPERGGPGEASS
jgi:hypothetical protein